MMISFSIAFSFSKAVNSGTSGHAVSPGRSNKKLYILNMPRHYESIRSFCLLTWYTIRISAHKPQTQLSHLSHGHKLLNTPDIFHKKKSHCHTSSQCNHCLHQLHERCIHTTYSQFSLPVRFITQIVTRLSSNFTGAHDFQLQPKE